MRNKITSKHGLFLPINMHVNGKIGKIHVLPFYDRWQMKSLCCFCPSCKRLSQQNNIRNCKTRKKRKTRPARLYWLYWQTPWLYWGCLEHLLHSTLATATTLMFSLEYLISFILRNSKAALTHNCDLTRFFLTFGFRPRSLFLMKNQSNMNGLISLKKFA